MANVRNCLKKLAENKDYYVMYVTCMLDIEDKKLIEIRFYSESGFKKRIYTIIYLFS
jgi:hypothetical protein